MDDRAALIEPLIPGLRRYARGWLRDTALADDIVQDCLERAVSSWRQRRGDAVRPWLYAILHNLLVDHGRRAPRRPTVVSIDTADVVALAVRAEQTDAIEHGDLLRSLDALPPDQKAVILLVSIEDLSYAEAATVLGIPVGTLMSRLSRARDRLAELIGAGARARLRRVK
ncbi:RNA polymerase sigma factor [Sphingomonas yunnanensis]|uniref:RNA polymerase sigma factor n=1 Tax=Sphingomonas yunnanensis TaxID=310400 RepID=UPI001CA79E4A|nr:RNA polymerase sigma factor [Sphingomonas yunnanensis]MBY9064892.1 RNA polymerase sigma factor [Sphingomonas yunnanensis]